MPNRSIIKVIFFLAMYPVLNLTNTVASAETLRLLRPYPVILIISLEPVGIVSGNCGVMICISESAASSFGQIKFTSIIEQFFEPGLLINNSKFICSPVSKTSHLQFLAFTIWGLAQKTSFNSIQSFIVPNLGMCVGWKTVPTCLKML